MPPHVYAVAESAYYNMNAYKDNQCIIIRSVRLDFLLIYNTPANPTTVVNQALGKPKQQSE